MFVFTIRNAIWLMVFVIAIAGAGCGRRTRKKIETVRQGVEDVDKHAKEIEKAAQDER